LAAVKIMITEIKHKGQLLAIIISHKFAEPGVHFFTPAHFSQQLAYMKQPAGKLIRAHTHNTVKPDAYYTKEVLIIKHGKLRVDFYDEDRNYVESRILEAGDVIMLAGGGHGFEVLEEVEMIEVQQGPYDCKNSKTLFEGVSENEIKIRGGADDTGE